MNVTLTPELQEFVEERVREGTYGSVDELVQAALLRMKHDVGSDEEIDSETLARLVAVGQAQADRGELVDSEEVFEAIARRSAQRRGLLP
jgi:antitoxin ParD1/3/4